MTGTPTQSSEAAGDAAATGIVDGVLRLIEAGGPVVVILLGLSVAALTIVIAKLWQFAAGRIGERRAARHALQLYRAGQASEALRVADAARGPLAAVLACALRGRRRDLPTSLVREECVRLGNDILAELRGWFRALEVIAALAPLLGLFGTVLGMIAAFQQLEQAGSQVNPAVLSGGIWEALLTTAVGLAVSMPVVAVLSWFERLVDRLAQDMDSLVTQVFTEDLSPAPDGNRRRVVETRHAAVAVPGN